MNLPPNPKWLIHRAMKTEMDRRLDRVREYLITQEKLTPPARLHYDALMRRLTNKETK